LAERWIAAAIRGRITGQQRNFNNGQQERCGPVPDHHQPPTPLEHRGGLFCAPHGTATNLTVQTNALATRVVIENGRATGVRVSSGTAHGQTARGAGRGDRLRRRLQFTPVAAIVRVGAGRAARGSGHSSGFATWPAVGADLQDHFYVRLAFSLHQADHLERCRQQPACAKMAGRGAIRTVPVRAVGDQRDLRRRLRAQRSALRASRHPAQFQPVELCRAHAGRGVPASVPPASPSARCICAPTRARRWSVLKSTDPLSHRRRFSLQTF